MPTIQRALQGIVLLLVYECVIIMAYASGLVLVDIFQALALAPAYSTLTLVPLPLLKFSLVIISLPVIAVVPEFVLVRKWENSGLTIRVLLLAVLILPVSAAVSSTQLLSQPVLLVVLAHGIAMIIFVVIYARRYRAGVLICLVTSVLMTGLLEVAARAIFPQPVYDARLPYAPNVSYTRTINLKGVTSPSRLSTNAWGFRGDPVPRDRSSAFVIITIGGSTTFDQDLDDERTYPARLQQTLRQTYPQVRVDNAGLNGHTTRGHLIVMERVMPVIQPQGVVFLVGVNDLGLSLTPEFQAQFDMVRNPWFFDSALFRFLWQQSQLTRTNRMFTSEAYQFVPQPVSGAEYALPGNLAEMLPSLPEYRLNLNRLIDLGQQQNLQMLFLTQPMLFEDNAYWDGIAGTSYWLANQKSITAAGYRRLMDKFNDALLEVCLERHVPCYDLAPIISGHPDYFTDSVHYTDFGAVKMGEAVASAIEMYWNINP